MDKNGNLVKLLGSIQCVSNMNSLTWFCEWSRNAKSSCKKEALLFPEARRGKKEGKLRHKSSYCGINYEGGNKVEWGRQCKTLSKWKLKILNWNILGHNDRSKRFTLSDFDLKMEGLNCISSGDQYGEHTFMLDTPNTNKQVAEWVELKGCGTWDDIVILWDERDSRFKGSHQRIYSITCILGSLLEDFRWVFTGVYGPHTNTKRADL